MTPHDWRTMYRNVGPYDRDPVAWKCRRCRAVVAPLKQMQDGWSTRPPPNSMHDCEIDEDCDVQVVKRVLED